MREHAAHGGRLVSSRLLHLEVHRIEIRELLAGREIAQLGRLAKQVNPLPVTEEVWQAAYDLEVHLRTLDSMHLATCQLIKGELLASDHGMLTAAEALRIPIHPSSGAG